MAQYMADNHYPVADASVLFLTLTGDHDVRASGARARVCDCVVRIACTAHHVHAARGRMHGCTRYSWSHLALS